MNIRSQRASAQLFACLVLLRVSGGLVARPLFGAGTCLGASHCVGMPTRHAMASGGQTAWDDPEFTAARYMNYRRDQLPVEKAVGLSGACTFKEAWAAVHDKRVQVDGTLAVLGDMVGAEQTLSLDGVVLPEREPIVCYLLNKPRQVMCTCSVGEKVLNSNNTSSLSKFAFYQFQIARISAFSN
jgi:hypothetical protein